mgnify:FL=1
MFALNSYQTLAVGILLYYLGKLLKQKIKFLQTYCIPNPVIGGVLFALLNLALFEAGTGAIKLDTVQQSFFMNMFFTSVGFSASYALLKKGGRDVFILTIVCAVLITFQNIIGVGVAKAKELIFSGKQIGAEEAKRIGLVNEVYAAEELLNKAVEMAKSFTANAPIAVKYSKACIDRGMQMDIDDGIALENELFAMCFATADQKEGMSAFVEKRKEKHFQNK